MCKNENIAEFLSVAWNAAKKASKRSIPAGYAQSDLAEMLDLAGVSIPTQVEFLKKEVKA